MAENNERKVFRLSTVIAVEGKDEVAFLEALRKARGLSEFDTYSVEGKDNFGPRISDMWYATGFQANVVTLGIIRDADNNPEGAFQSICSALDRANFPVPDLPEEIKLGQPNTSIFIVPPGGHNGMLETLCLESVQGQPALECAYNYFTCLQDNGHNLPANFDKATCQVYLASYDKVGLSIGPAAGKGYLPLDSNVFDPIVEWLDRIVSNP